MLVSKLHECIHYIKISHAVDLWFIYISVCMLVISGSQMRLIFASQGTSGILWRNFSCPNGEHVLASSEYRPSYNILQQAAQLPTTKNYLYISKSKCSK